MNTAYASWADKRFSQRDEIEAGLVPLVPPPASKLLLSNESTISDIELANVIRQVGIAKVLDVAVMIEGETVTMMEAAAE